MAVPSADAAYPTTLPTTGGEMGNLWLLALLGGGLALVAGGLILQARKSEVAAK
jgi:hypothetical protein